MTVIAIILAGSAPLQFSSLRDFVANMRQPHFARVRARRNCATNAGRELIKDTPPIDELAICVPRDRKCAFYTVRQTLVYGNMRKITENIQRFTTEYGNSANPRRTNQLLVNRGCGVSLFNGIAQYSCKPTYTPFLKLCPQL